MSALNVLKRRDVIHVVSDGGYYDDDGRVLSFGCKVYPIAHFPGFVGALGRVLAGPLLAAALGQAASDIDALFDKIELLLPEFEDRFEDVLEDGVSGMMVGGWSAARNEMRLGYIKGRAKSEPDIHTLKIFAGDQAIAWPVISEARQLDAFGRLFYSIDDVPAPEDYAKRQLMAQRHTEFELPSGRKGCGIGGFGQLTTITRDGVGTKIVARYPDRVGEYMTPEPIDWAAFRAEGTGASTAGLSRLQRDMLARKQRKAERRAS